MSPRCADDADRAPLPRPGRASDRSDRYCVRARPFSDIRILSAVGRWRGQAQKHENRTVQP
jgi:hypothetical protein